MSCRWCVNTSFSLFFFLLPCIFWTFQSFNICYWETSIDAYRSSQAVKCSVGKFLSFFLSFSFLFSFQFSRFWFSFSLSNDIWTSISQHQRVWQENMGGQSSNAEIFHPSFLPILSCGWNIFWSVLIAFPNTMEPNLGNRKAFPLQTSQLQIHFRYLCQFKTELEAE